MQQENTDEGVEVQQENAGEGIEKTPTGGCLKKIKERAKSLWTTIVAIALVVGKFFARALLFLALLVLIFGFVYWLTQQGVFLDKWQGVGAAEMVVKISKYGNLVAVLVALAALFTTYLSFEHKRASDERVAFYNSLHWAIDKLETAEGESRETAFKLARTIWESRVTQENEKEILELYTRYFHDVKSLQEERDDEIANAAPLSEEMICDTGSDDTGDEVSRGRKWTSWLRQVQCLLRRER